jgi:tRNA pseudouridine32 synthase/23S rRNA pseudouridine746 synthase/23S rRNA pseudouridine955/2504/2580 synthase
MLVIPGRRGGEVTLRERLEAQLRREVWVVHRLDRGTSGVLVFALSAQAHRALSMAFEEGAIHKRYLALVEGAFPAEQEVSVALTSGRKGRTRPVRPGEAGKAARTRFHLLERFATASWVEVFPETGRTHQIRVHARAVGHPLLVDPLYGARGPLSIGSVSLSRTPLHAAELRWAPLQEVGAAELSAPVPADLTAVLATLRGEAS